MKVKESASISQLSGQVCANLRWLTTRFLFDALPERAREPRRIYRATRVQGLANCGNFNDQRIERILLLAQNRKCFNQRFSNFFSVAITPRIISELQDRRNEAIFQGT